MKSVRVPRRGGAARAGSSGRMLSAGRFQGDAEAGHSTPVHAAEAARSRVIPPRNRDRARVWRLDDPGRAPFAAHGSYAAAGGPALSKKPKPDVPGGARRHGGRPREAGERANLPILAAGERRQPPKMRQAAGPRRYEAGNGPPGVAVGAPGRPVYGADPASRRPADCPAETPYASARRHAGMPSRAENAAEIVAFVWFAAAAGGGCGRTPMPMPDYTDNPSRIKCAAKSAGLWPAARPRNDAPASPDAPILSWNLRGVLYSTDTTFQ